MKPTIRDATIADAPAISELICRVAQETIFADGPEEGCRYFLAMNTPAAVAGKMSGHAYRYYVAELPDRIVGLAAILNNAHLYHLCIDTNVKGTGVGRSLLEHVRDECLRRVAACLRDTVRRPADLVARYGGEEFVCLLPETSLDGALQVARQLGASVAGLGIEHAHSDAAAVVTVSLGVCTGAGAAGGDVGALLRGADAQLYQAKSLGRHRCCGAELALA